MSKLNAIATASIAFLSLSFATTTPAYAEDLKVSKQVAPNYPKRAERRGITGFVTLSFEVSTDGKVQSPKVIEASPEGVFDEAAVEALSAWKFEPLTAPQQSEITIEFNAG